MRLLDKRAATAEIATQRAQTIKEGLNLAKKVDALRETLQEENGNLETFRRETIAKVQQEIDVKISEKDFIEGKLIPMREEYERLLLPPDLRKDRAEVQEQLVSLQIAIDKVQTRESELKSESALNTKQKLENEEERQRIDEEHRRSTELLSKADALKDDAVKVLFAARAEAKKIINNAKEREEAVAVREVEVADREVQVIKLKQTIDADEIDLASREKKLRVNQEVFIKSQNYLRNKK